MGSAQGPMLCPGEGASSSRDCFVQRLTNTSYWRCYWLNETFYRFLTVPPSETPLPPEPVFEITGDARGRRVGAVAGSEVLMIGDLVGTGVPSGAETSVEFTGDGVGSSS